jgi:hypothetical protein
VRVPQPMSVHAFATEHVDAGNDVFPFETLIDARAKRHHYGGRGKREASSPPGRIEKTSANDSEHGMEQVFIALVTACVATSMYVKYVYRRHLSRRRHSPSTVRR